MNVRVAINVAMWFVAWTSMLGGFGLAFTLPQDLRDDIYNELMEEAYKKWVVQQETAQSKRNASADKTPNRTSEQDQSNSSETKKPTEFSFTISEEELTKAVDGSAKSDHVAALSRVAMIVGVVGTVFFVVLVILAAVRELRSESQLSEYAVANSDPEKALQTTGEKAPTDSLG